MILGKKYPRQFFQRWLAIFLATVGFSAAVITLLSITLGIWMCVIFLFSCVIVSFAITRLTVFKTDFPIEDVIPFDLERKRVACIHFPCDRNLTKQANELARDYYGQDSIRFELYEQWRAKNSLILTCLTDKNNNFVGYFDIIPLRSSFISRLVSGVATEKEIISDDILPEEEMRNAKNLYFAGIAVRNPMTTQGKHHAAILIWAALSYIKQFYSLESKKKMYAVAATEQGQKILERLGFKVISASPGRADKHNLYFKMLSSNVLQLFESSLWKLEKACDFSSYQKYLKRWSKKLDERIYLAKSEKERSVKTGPK